jgi:hypothetical protein
MTLQMKSVEVQYFGKDRKTVVNVEHLKLTKAQCRAVAAETGVFCDKNYRLQAVCPGGPGRIFKMMPKH